MIIKKCKEGKKEQRLACLQNKFMFIHFSFNFMKEYVFGNDIYITTLQKFGKQYSDKDTI